MASSVGSDTEDFPDVELSHTHMVPVQKHVTKPPMLVPGPYVKPPSDEFPRDRLGMDVPPDEGITNSVTRPMMFESKSGMKDFAELVARNEALQKQLDSVV